MGLVPIGHHYYEGSDFCQPLHPIVVRPLFRSRWADGRSPWAWNIGTSGVPHRGLLTINRPRSVSGSSPCLIRLNFRTFHLQPPNCHFATLDLSRYHRSFIVVAATPTAGRHAG